MFRKNHFLILLISFSCYWIPIASQTISPTTSASLQDVTTNIPFVTKLPDNIPRCYEGDNINECIANGFNYMLRNVLKGVPEMNIPPLDPLVLNKLNVQFANNLIRGKAAIRNIKITGLSQSTVRKIQYQRKDKVVTLNIHYQLPIIELTGKYRAEVMLSNAKFSSKGIFNITLIDVDSKSEHAAELYERDGHTFLKTTKLNLDPTVGDMKIFATGLVPDAALNDALLEIANSNWRIIYKSAVSSTRSTWEPIFLNYVNDILSHFPYDLVVAKSKEE